MPDRMLAKLLEETTLSIEAGDLPIGCALAVEGELVDSDHNMVRSQKGLHFHAERNLLGRLVVAAIPTGRRVLWVTLEPCLRCAQAIQRFGVDEVVYVLDDPFHGGKALLAEAGITLTKRDDWECAILQRMMDSFALYPELCAGKWFPSFLAAWQRHNPLGHEEPVRSVFLHHLAPYLSAVLLHAPETRQAEIRRLFLSHVDILSTLTLRECGGTPSPSFVANLHRALFPPDYRHRAVGDDGAVSETASGEWRKYVVPPRYTGFSVPEAIEADLNALLSSLSGMTSWRREDALRFYFDFTSVRPFADGNGRLAAILADVICLNHGLAPLALDGKNALFYAALMQGLSRGSPISDQLYLVDAWNEGQVEINPPPQHYDEQPSAFQTYVRRSGYKRHVVEQIFAKLADHRLGQPFVATDIGAGTGIIADGILHGLLQREGVAFEYHYLEPSRASVDYFRAHSHHATLSQVVIHTMPMEDFLLPPSDLIIVSQALQWVSNPLETLCDIAYALKPDGMALVVLTHPDSDEWRMMKRLTHGRPSYVSSKELLDKERIQYEEVVVESHVRVSMADRDTPEGDDLLTFYFNAPATMLPGATKEAFWAGLNEFVRNGAISKKEAFFWITAGADAQHAVRECCNPGFVGHRTIGPDYVPCAN